MSPLNLNAVNSKTFLRFIPMFLAGLFFIIAGAVFLISSESMPEDISIVEMDSRVKDLWIRQDSLVVEVMESLQEELRRIDTPDVMRKQIRERFRTISNSAVRQGFVAPRGFTVYDGEGELLIWAGTNPPGLVTTDLSPNAITRFVTELPAGSDLIYQVMAEDLVLQVLLPLHRDHALSANTSTPGIVQFLESRCTISVTGLFSISSPVQGDHQLMLTPETGLEWSPLSHDSSGDFASGMTVYPWVSIFLFLGVMSLLFAMGMLLQPFRAGTRIIGSLILSAAGYFVTIAWPLPGSVMPAALTDTRIYAGIFPLPELPWQLLLTGMIMWVFIASVQQALSLKTRQWWTPLTAGLLVVILDPWIHYLAELTVRGSSLEWWPAVVVSGHPGSLLVVIALILLIESMVVLAGIVCGMLNGYRDYLACIIPVMIYCTVVAIFKPEWSMGVFVPIILLVPVAAGIRRYGLSRTRASRPGILLQSAITACLILPSLMGTAHNEALNTVSENLRHWVINRDELRVFALRENLEQLRNHTALRAYLTDSVGDFPAFVIWRDSDLSAVSENYGIEIRDVGGELLDRFAPELPHQPDPWVLISRVRETPDTPIILPYRIRQNAFEPDLMGAVAVMDGKTQIGSLLIRLPAGPLSALPGTGEWGARVRIYPVDVEGTLRLPPSEVPVPDDLFPREGGTGWVIDEAAHRNLQLFRVVERDPSRHWMVLAIMPDRAFSGYLAGLVRLTVLGWLLFLPLAWLIFFSGKTTPDERIGFWTFRRQILVSFTVTAVVIPVIMAGVFQGIFQEVMSNHENRTVRALADSALDHVRSNALETGQNLLDKVTHGLIGIEDETPWMILDARGQPVEASQTLPDRLPDLDKIFQVYQNRSHLTEFFRNGNGELAVRIYLYRESDGDDDTDTRGTFIAELPVTSSLVRQSIQTPLTAVDLYSRNRITASSRPELFNTGFLPMILPESVDRSFREKRTPGAYEIIRNNPGFTCYVPIMDVMGSRVGMLAIHGNFPAEEKSYSRLADTALVTMAGLLMAGIFLMSVLGGRLSRPVRLLTRGAMRVAEGNLSEPVSRKTGGEMGHLINSFNRMMTDLAAHRLDLEQRHQFITALLRNMSSGIMAVDEGNRIVTVNQSLCDMFDMNDTALIGSDFDAVMISLKLEEFRGGVSDYRNNLGPGELTCRYFTGGQVRYLRVGLAHIAGVRERSGDLLLVLDDISDTVRSTKMQAYTEIARRIAHEVKNPLTPIQLSIEHLRQTYSDEAPTFPEVFETCTQMILDEVGSLERIATEFSRFSRFPEPEFQEEDIRILLEEIAGLYPVPPHGIILDLSYGDAPLKVRMDHDQMKRVLVNIIQNGFHAMETGGRLEIDARREGGLVNIRICDTGKGMDEETVLHLFEPYFSTRQEGIGLGLVITKATIDAHQGEIRVTSEPGKGSRFIISLPAVSGSGIE